MQLAHILAKNNRFDLWRYAAFLPEIAEQCWVSDRRTDFTPLEQRDAQLWIKHEDEHPIGSHKGRSIAYQLSVLHSQSVLKIVLSSSGNAAIALAKLNDQLDAFVFVSPQMDEARASMLATLSSSQTKVVMTPFPRNFAQYLVRQHQYIDIRPSQSEDAIVGLRTLGFELAEQMDNLSQEIGIFAVTTSGANMLGMYQAFMILQERGMLKTPPRLFPVLMTDYHGGTLTKERRQQLELAVAQTGGKILLHQTVYDGPYPTSFEGNTAFAAYEKEKKHIDKAVVIFTGKKWPVMPLATPLPQCATLQALKHDYQL